MRVAISVVMPTHDRAHIIRHSLARVLRQQPGVPFEVIVVDDGSTDATPDVLGAIDDPHLVTLRIPRAGTTAARNRALAVARGELVVFLDDDAFVGAGFLDRHRRAHERGARVLAAGGIIDVHAIPGADVTVGGWWRGYHRHPMPGGNASVRLAHLRATGGFDEAFDTYGWQDQELAERLLARGLRRRFVWGAPILHYRDPSVIHDLRHELAREVDRGRMGARFYHKHRSLFVGVTTKMSPPLRALERVLAPALGLEPEARAILAGRARGSAVSAARLALLRAHVEISAGRAEWQRLTGAARDDRRA